MFEKWIRGYNHKSIEMFVNSAKLSALSANFIAPLIVLFVVYDFFSALEISIWIGIHALILFFRVLLQSQISLSSNDKISKTLYKKINALFFLVNATAFIFALMIFISALYKIPIENFFMLCAVLLSLSAGSISTLMSVFHYFALFVLTLMLSSVLSLLYYGDNISNTFALLLSLFTFIFLKAGYTQYTLINNLTSLKESFEAIYEKSSDGIALYKGKQYIDCNEAIVKMFGYESKNDILNADISTLMPEYQEERVSSLKKMLTMIKRVKQKNHVAFEWKYKRRDGSLFWSEVVLTKIYIDSQELIHGVYRDISAKKELELQKDLFQSKLQEKVLEVVNENRQKDQAMLHQSKLAQMGEMISMIAHQWRQPLSAISATSSSLGLKAQIGTLDNETTKELSLKITGYAQHLSSTIDDFRNFFQENKTKERTSFEKMLTNTLNIVRHSLENAQIELLVDIQESCEVETYANEVNQVILNIIKNAEDALLENNIQNPKINITISNATLTISDNAGGIPQELQEKIFEPYFSTKMKKDGTGLGLYMSKTIIEEHCGGKLRVSNDAYGAIFTIELEEAKV